MSHLMSRWVPALVLTIAVVITATGVAQADTITVCPSGCDYANIQAAIDAASAGDAIEVRSGTYYENVNVNKQLTLQGLDTGAENLWWTRATVGVRLHFLLMRLCLRDSMR